MTTLFRPGEAVLNGQIILFTDPQPGRYYVAGFDAAKGIIDRDFDAFELFDERGEQCAVAYGHWGENAGPILDPLIDHYGGTRVFIVGERADWGLISLRYWFDHGRWMYFDRDETKRGRPTRDVLGHAPTAMDHTVQRLRAALGPRDGTGALLPPTIKIRHEETHRQLMRFSFRPKSRAVDYETATDRQLVWGAPVGDHDDLVRATALAVAGLEWVPEFVPPKPVFAPGTDGYVLGLNKPTAKKSKWG